MWHANWMSSALSRQTLQTKQVSIWKNVKSPVVIMDDNSNMGSVILEYPRAYVLTKRESKLLCLAHLAPHPNLREILADYRTQKGHLQSPRIPGNREALKKVS